MTREPLAYPGDPYNDPNYDEVAILKAEVERLTARCEDDKKELWEYRELFPGLRAEVARLTALLRETIPFINDAGNDEDPEAQARANDLFVRIAVALEPKP